MLLTFLRTKARQVQRSGRALVPKQLAITTGISASSPIGPMTAPF